jgi:hypothetical protein
LFIVKNSFQKSSFFCQILLMAREIVCNNFVIHKWNENLVTTANYSNYIIVSTYVLSQETLANGDFDVHLSFPFSIVLEQLARECSLPSQLKRKLKTGKFPSSVLVAWITTFAPNEINKNNNITCSILGTMIKGFCYALYSTAEETAVLWDL